MKRISKIIVGIFTGLYMIASTGCSLQTTSPAKDAKAPGSEPVELKVYLSTPIQGVDEDSSVFDNNPLAKEILEKLNVKIKYVFPTDNGDKELRLDLASGELSDIVITYNIQIADQMIKEGLAVPLNDYIDKYGPNIKQSYGSLLDVLKYPDGKNYFLRGNYGTLKSGEKVSDHGDSFAIRKDVYEELGSPKIDTAEDIFKLLQKMKEKYPKNSAGEKIWPVGGFIQGWQDPLNTLMDAAGIFDSKWYVDDNNQLKLWFRAPYALDIVKYMNRLVNNDLIDPEAFTTKQKYIWEQTKLNKGLVLGHFGGSWMTWDARFAYKEAGFSNWSNMDFIYFPFRFQNGQRPELINVHSTGMGYTLITKSCKNPEAAVKLLNLLSDEDFNLKVVNGAEGQIWNMKDGKPVLTEAAKNAFMEGKGDSEFYSSGFTLYKSFCSKALGRNKYGSLWILKDDSSLNGDTRFVDRDNSLGSYWYDIFPFADLLMGAPDEITAMDPVYVERMKTTIYECILAKSQAECEQRFLNFVNSLDSVGIAKYEKYSNEAYQKKYEQFKKLNK